MIFLILYAGIDRFITASNYRRIKFNFFCRLAVYRYVGFFSIPFREWEAGY